MFLDARSFPLNETINTDICIVGAGASGITLALEFINTPFNVVLVESGGLRFRHDIQWLYRGENIGRPYDDLEFTKQRYFGGASNKWYGRCRPLDAIDFEKKPWVPYSGWPFGKDALDPYYERAHAVCQLGPYNYDPGYWESGSKRQLSIENKSIETKIFQFSPPTKFGKEYRHKIANAKNIKTFLFANAVSISVDASGRKVSAINFATLYGRTFKIKAKMFILAASALENTRLLLVSNDIYPGGIGNQHGLAGRFFMEHPHIYCGALVSPLPPSTIRYYNILDYNKKADKLGTAGALGVTEDMVRQDRMLNASAFMVRRKDYQADDCYFSKAAFALTQVVDTFTHTTAPGTKLFQNLNTAHRHKDKIFAITAKRMKGLLHSKNWVSLRAQIETVPNPESRIRLSNQKDRLGVNKLIMDWRLSPQDLENFHKFQAVLFAALVESGHAVRPFNHETDETGWPVTMVSGKHHMGTTRMHSDPQKGVVDPDCRVNGVVNLYIAGSSVFPTSGQANPMLTIIALSIRLADHVKEKMKKNE